MKVNITYHDLDSLTVEEIVRQAQHNYGKNVTVEITPESWIAYDAIYFGIQQLITHKQLSIIFDKKAFYQHEIKELRNDVLAKVEEVLNQVIIDNESRVT
jgi:hypothetical protein